MHFVLVSTSVSRDGTRFTKQPFIIIKLYHLHELKMKCQHVMPENMTLQRLPSNTDNLHMKHRLSYKTQTCIDVFSHTHHTPFPFII